MLVRLDTAFVRETFCSPKDAHIRITPRPGELVDPSMAILACRLEEVTDHVRVSSKELLNVVYVDLLGNWHVYVRLPNRGVVAVELSCGNYVTTLCRRNLTDDEAREKARPYYTDDLKIVETADEVLEDMPFTEERFLTSEGVDEEKEGDLLTTLSSFMSGDDRAFTRQVAEESRDVQYGLTQEKREALRRQVFRDVAKYDVEVELPDVGVKDLLAVEHVASTLQPCVEELYSASKHLRHCGTAMVSAVVWVNRDNWLSVVGDQTPTVPPLFIPPTPLALDVSRRRVSFDSFMNSLLGDFMHSYDVHPSTGGGDEDRQLVGALLLSMETRVRVNDPPSVEFAKSGTFFATNYHVTLSQDADPRMLSVFCRALSQHFKFDKPEFRERILSYDPLRGREDAGELRVMWTLGERGLVTRVVDPHVIEEAEKERDRVACRLRAGMKMLPETIDEGRVPEMVRHVQRFIDTTHTFAYATMRGEDDEVKMAVKSPLLSSTYKVTFSRDVAFHRQGVTMNEFLTYIECG